MFNDRTHNPRILVEQVRNSRKKKSNMRKGGLEERKKVGIFRGLDLY